MIIYYNENTGVITGYETSRIGSLPTNMTYIDMYYTPLPSGENPYDYVVDLQTLTLIKKDQISLDNEILDKLINDKTLEIKNAFEIAKILPVEVLTSLGTFLFSGGESSAQSLDGKRRMVQESFALSIVPTDDVTFLTDKTDPGGKRPVIITMIDAIKVTLAVASRYEDDLYHKEGLINILNVIKNDALKTTQEKITAINAITWDTVL